MISRGERLRLQAHGLPGRLAELAGALHDGRPGLTVAVPEEGEAAAEQRVAEHAQRPDVRAQRKPGQRVVWRISPTLVKHRTGAQSCRTCQTGQTGQKKYKKTIRGEKN